MKRTSILIYTLFLFTLVVYSYSQIDLNLTLTQWSPYQKIQAILIQLGYFNRPLSSALYIFFILLFTVFYLIILYQVRKGRLNIKELTLLVVGTGLILTLSYPAFSHDIFNYMFDARIITKYGMNPYSFKALDFPGDLWIRFMHWTHRTYPYGPLWIILTTPFSYLGFQKFTLTLFNFKLLFLAGFYLNSYLINKISGIVNPKNALYSTAFFALNPLILIETVLSPHNDSIMLLFALVSIYALLKNKLVFSLISMLVSAAVKFVTLSLVPVIIYLFKAKPTDIKKQNESILTLMLIISLISTAVAVYYHELLPWYAIVPFGFISLLTNHKIIQILGISLSVGLLSKYVSFLYNGEWTNGAYSNYLILLLLIIIFSIIYFFINSIRLNILKSKL